MTGASPRIARVLSIAGTDPTGGAGIQADLKSIAANGGYGMAVVTALVAQNTHGVRSVHVPPVSFLREQLHAVSDDVEIDAVKIGMLADVHVTHTVSEWLGQVKPRLVVLDPVMIATSGDRLLTEDAEQALRDLLSVVHLVTPNIPELAILAGSPVATSWSAALRQAQQVAETVRGPRAGQRRAPRRLPRARCPRRCPHRARVSRAADLHPEYPRNRVFLLLRRRDQGGVPGRHGRAEPRALGRR
ncbi:hypothetical protein E3O10_15445, partial [Cryobacterium luteum]